MKSWDWRSKPLRGVRKYALWLQPAAVAVPWIMVGMLLLMLHMIGGTLTASEGVVFDLPSTGLSDGEATPLVALVMSMPNGDETYVFFDDARYALGSDISISAFTTHLSERVAKTEGKALLVLADRNVTCEQLGRLAAVSRKCGLERILLAHKRSEVSAE